MRALKTTVSRSPTNHPILFEEQSHDEAPDRKIESDLISTQASSKSSVLKHLSQKRKKRRLLIGGIIMSDIFSIICAFLIVNFIRLDTIGSSQVYNMLLTIVPIHLAIALNNKAYQTNILTDLWRNISRGSVALLLAAASMLLILFFFKTSNEFSRIMFGFGTSLGIILIILFRAGIFKLGGRLLGSTPYADLCIFDYSAIPADRKTKGGAILASDYGLTANPADATAVNRLGNLVSGMDRIVVHAPAEKREAWVFMLQSIDVNSEIVVPELDMMKALAIRKRSGSTSLVISAGQLRWDQTLVKRVFDITIVLCSAPLTIPILLLTAVIVKLDSPGPVLFKQSRIGLGNRPFRIWKFRSMRVEESDQNGNTSTARNDDRITKVGKFIRKSSIDELPQLANVLMGNMSIVGPRPHASGSTAEDALFWDIDQRYWHRHAVKPGLTGLAQIRGYRGATEQQRDLSDRLQSDLEYVATWSLWNDIIIFLKTFSVLFHKNAF